MVRVLMRRMHLGNGEEAWRFTHANNNTQPPGALHIGRRRRAECVQCANMHIFSAHTDNMCAVYYIVCVFAVRLVCISSCACALSIPVFMHTFLALVRVCVRRARDSGIIFARVHGHIFAAAAAICDRKRVCACVRVRI